MAVGKKRTPLAILAVVALAVAARFLGIDLSALEGETRAGATTEVAATPTGSPARPSSTAVSDGAAAVRDAFDNRGSDIIVELEGEVARTLPDDREGSQHQRFILELPGGHTVLVAHNIDLAPRVPLSEGERISLKGEYEWNDRGGVVHWTHHDPAGRHPGGWIEHSGKRYE